MPTRITRRHFLTTGAAVLPFAALADAPAQSIFPAVRPPDFHRRAILSAEDLISRARLGGNTTAVVADLATGRMIERIAPEISLPPASVTKAVTALYALEALGPAYTYTTRLIATHAPQNGVLQGDLILAGGGDPTLDTDGLALLAQNLRAAGVQKVTGKFYVWGGALPFHTEITPDQEDHLGYNPAISGLNLNYNRVHFEWRRTENGYGVTMDARSANHRPDVRVARMSIAPRDLPVFTYRDAGAFDQWSVARGALGKGGARWLPVRKPELYAGEVFASFAAAQGITLPPATYRKAAPQGVELTRLTSVPMAEMLRDMLKYSTNLTAETIGMSASQARGHTFSDLHESARAMTRWMRGGFGALKSSFVDHSGLGEKSRLTAEDMVRMLLSANAQNALRPLLKPIDLRGPDNKVDPNHPIKVNAKTGTLNFVSTLAGYAVLPGGQNVAFAIFSANLEARRRAKAVGDEVPEGAREWNKRAKILQQAMIERWGALQS